MNHTSPFFIIGNPRSGTSLLRLMLTCHPNIIVPPESHFFLWLEEKYGEGITSANKSEFVVDLLNSTKFETWGVPKESIVQLLNAEYIPYSKVIRDIYLLYGSIHDKERILAWGDKNKLWKEKLGDILKYYPDSKFIHIVRDGRDVACSFKKLENVKSDSKYAPKLPSKIDAIAHRWSQNISAIRNFLKTVPGHNQITLKYEDLIEDPEIVLRKVTELLSVNYSSIMLSYSKENELHKYEPDEFMAWKDKLNRGLDKTNIGKFRNILDRREINTFDSIAGKCLKYYGYQE